MVFLILYEGDELQLMRKICYPHSILNSNSDNFEYSKLRCQPDHVGRYIYVYLHICVNIYTYIIMYVCVHINTNT